MTADIITGVKQCPECMSLKIESLAWRGGGNYVEVDYTCQKCGTKFLYVSGE